MNWQATEETMHQDGAGNYRQKDYWVVQNLEYSEPSFRLHKCSRILKHLARGRECSLLDVGCGPGALRQVLSANIKYHGIDIAIQQPTPFMREIDFAKKPISFDGRSFDFICTLGVLEYMGTLQTQKFREIKSILNPGGKFITSYINFGHFRPLVWPNYNNVQSIKSMASSLSEVFKVERYFPASHHWRQKQPGKYALRGMQMHINFNIPVLSPALAVEYFFVCSHK